LYLQMTEAELIKLESMLRADLSNGDVVARILMADSAKCTCCNFPQHKEDFDRLLARYSQARINETRWKQRYCDSRLDETYYKNASWEIENRYLEATRHAAHLRDLLDKMQPCFRCRLRYNPTGKARFMGKVFEKKPYNLVNKVFGTVLKG